MIYHIFTYCLETVIFTLVKTVRKTIQKDHGNRVMSVGERDSV